MANFYKGHSLEELLRERMLQYPPPPYDDQSAWLAARELWPLGPPAQAPPPSPPASSGSNNNNNDDDDLAVVRAGPATAVPDEAIDPRLLSAAAALPAATTTSAAPASVAVAAAATAAPAPAAAAPAPAAAAAAAPAAAPAAQPRRGRTWTLQERAELRARREAGQGFDQIGQALDRTAAACETQAKVLRIFKG